MGNVSGRKEEDQEEYYMEYVHGHGHGLGYGQAQASNSSYHAHLVQPPTHSSSPRAYQSPLMFTPQVPVVPIQNPNQTMHMKRADLHETSAKHPSAVPEKEIPVIISWIHDGAQVAIEGSWDNWKTRESLEGSSREFSIMKVLRIGAYNYRFIVDGQWTYDPELPYECDNMGNVFNILDVKDDFPQDLNTGAESGCPSSPLSSYNNAPFTLEDLNEKLPEMPPLLQQTPLDLPSSKDHPQALQKPLSANLNHLYIQRGRTSHPTVALGSTQRFRSKFITTVLYKPLNKLRK